MSLIKIVALSCKQFYGLFAMFGAISSEEIKYLYYVIYIVNDTLLNDESIPYKSAIMLNIINQNLFGGLWENLMPKFLHWSHTLHV